MKKVYLVYEKKNSNSKKIKTDTINISNNINITNYKKILIKSKSIYYFLKVKKINLDIIKLLKKKKNTLIYESLDIFINNDNINSYIKQLFFLKFFDILICNNHTIKKILKEFFPHLNFFVIYHEFDNRFKNSNIINKKIYYLGSLNKFSLSDSINKYSITHIPTGGKHNKNLHKSSYCGIHIDFLLKNNFYYNLHTSTKLSTCLFFNSIFICNKIPVYYEILGSDYPLYINDDLTNINKVIENAYKILDNKEKYNEYLNNMKKYKIMLSPKNTSNEYKKIFISN